MGHLSLIEFESDPDSSLACPNIQNPLIELVLQGAQPFLEPFFLGSVPEKETDLSDPVWVPLLHSSNFELFQSISVYGGLGWKNITLKHTTTTGNQ